MEILSVTHQYGAWLCMLFFGLLALMLFCRAWDSKEKKRRIRTFIYLLFSIGIFIGGIMFCNDAAHKKVIKVTITDWNKVDFTKYKITDNEGKIVTLTEK